jgi:hypothetical protein
MIAVTGASGFRIVVGSSIQASVLRNIADRRAIALGRAIPGLSVPTSSVTDMRWQQ